MSEIRERKVAQIKRAKLNAAKTKKKESGSQGSQGEIEQKDLFSESDDSQWTGFLSE